MKAKVAAYLRSEQLHEDVMDMFIIAVGGFILLMALLLH